MISTLFSEGRLKEIKQYMKDNRITNVNNININDDMTTILHISLKSYEITKFLLENGVDPNIQNISGYTPIFYTSNLKVAKLLIKYGADINFVNHNLNPLLFNVFNFEVFRTLIKLGANYKNINLLHYICCRSGDTRVLRLALKYIPEEVDYKDNYDLTPLEWAKVSQNHRFIRLLMLYKIKNKEGTTIYRVPCKKCKWYFSHLKFKCERKTCLVKFK